MSKSSVPFLTLLPIKIRIRYSVDYVQDLRTINTMLRGATNGANGGVIKRLPLNDDGAIESPAKRSMTTGSPAVLAKRLEKVMTERKATTGSN